MVTLQRSRQPVKVAQLRPGHIPVTKLRQAVKAAGQVNVLVPFDGRYPVLLRVSKASVLEAIGRMKQRAGTVRASEIFGALVIG
jgi:hypothetical protein